MKNHARSVHNDIDGFDLRILRALQEDARLTNQELADQVALSPSQCSRRRIRLEESGHIRAIRAELDTDLLSFSVLVFMNITLSRHSRDTANLFRDHVRRLPNVLEAYAATGEADYVLKVRVPDLAALAAFVNDELLVHESVAQLRSTIALEEVKSGAGLPI